MAENKTDDEQQGNVKRRDVLRAAALAAPAILTLSVVPRFASAASGPWDTQPATTPDHFNDTGESGAGGARSLR